jgi:MFS family permease
MAQTEAAEAERASTPRGDFPKFWFGQVCSNLGSSFTLFVLPLLVFKLTGSAMDLAIAGVASALPGILFGLVIGAWVDRADRKRLMIVVDLLRAAAVASIPVLDALGLLAVGWIYAVGFVGAALSTCFVAAQATAVVALVAHDDLVAANGRIQASYSAAGILGPLLAGALAAILPLPVLLLIDALTFVISALSLGWIRASFNRPTPPVPTQIGAAIREGLAYLFRHPVLRALAVYGLLLNFVAASLGAQLVFFAKEQLHAADAQLGLLYGAQSAGALGVALLAGHIRRRVRWSRAILGATIAHGALALCLAFSPFLWVAAACLAGMAGMIALMGINVLSLRQAIVPNQLLGRVSTGLGVMVGCAMPLGTLAGGFAIEQIGSVQAVFAVIGVSILVLGIVFVFSPLRTAERYLPEHLGG